MKKIFKAIGFGIALGAALFFIPFVVKFLFGMLLIVGVIKLIFGRRRRQRFGSTQMDMGYQNFNSIVAIDNQWYRQDLSFNGLTNQIDIK